MTVLDLKAFGKRNVWRLPTGETAVRPGLRRIGTATASQEVTYTVDFDGYWE